MKYYHLLEIDQNVDIIQDLILSAICCCPMHLNANVFCYQHINTPSIQPNYPNFVQSSHYRRLHTLNFPSQSQDKKKYQRLFVSHAVQASAHSSAVLISVFLNNLQKLEQTLSFFITIPYMNTRGKCKLKELKNQRISQRFSTHPPKKNNVLSASVFFQASSPQYN